MNGLILAFDTSGPVGSVALAGGRETLGSRFLLHQSRHASALIPAVSSLLGEAEASPADLTGLVVGAGPGSFTGVRVAAATAKGLAAALGIPVWAVSSLLAAAASAGVETPREATGESPGEAHGDEGESSPRAVGRHEPTAETEGGPLGGTGPVAVLFDARGDRIYAAGYDLPASGAAGEGPVELIPPVATTLGGLLGDARLPREALLCGDGAVRHAGTLRDAGFRVAPPPLGLPTAEGLLRVRRVWPSLPPLRSVGDWEPEYLRSTGARPLAGR